MPEEAEYTNLYIQQRKTYKWGWIPNFEAQCSEKEDAIFDPAHPPYLILSENECSVPENHREGKCEDVLVYTSEPLKKILLCRRYLCDSLCIKLQRI